MCSGISKAGYFQPMFSRVAAISSTPRGAPCAAPVFAFFGAPFAMTVLQQINVGRERSAFAATIAASIASGSWPLTPGMTYQPYPSKRRGVSSVNHCRIEAFSESIEIPLSSQKAISLERPSVPASEHAS